MPKYRPYNTLTQEQRVEVAILLNAGVPYKELTEGYGASLSNIHKHI